MGAPFIAVTGRFQPFHNDHLELTMVGVEECGRVVLGITNPDVRSRVEDSQSLHRHSKEANPFTYFERQRIIARSLTMAGLEPTQFDIVPFPLEAPRLWHDYIPPHAVQLVRTFTKWEDRKIEMLRSGGYEVRGIPGNARTRISASDIRAAMAAGTDWREQLPAGAVDVLSEFGDVELARRCARQTPDK